MGKEGGEGYSGVPGLAPVSGPGLIVITPSPPQFSVCGRHWLVQKHIRVVDCQVGSHVLQLHHRRWTADLWCLCKHILRHSETQRQMPTAEKM